MSVANHIFDYSQGSLSTIPSLLWEYYLEYLWFYEPGTGVARIAYTFRVLAFLLIIPMTGITLLDIASYVIARTLGVVDDVKASTSDKNTIHAKSDSDAPIILLNDDSFPASTPGSADPSHTHNPAFLIRTEDPEKVITASFGGHPQAYFASDEMDLRLSGVDVFSPAVSRPTSPEVDRKGSSRTEGDTNEGSRLRKRG
jgi:hypothetical protein